MTDDPEDWTFDEVSDTLMEMNEWLTSDGIHEAVLSGSVGYHIFAANSDTPTEGVNKHLHLAFDRVLEEVCLDADVVADQHGEVTPETVCLELERQLQYRYRGELLEDFVAAFNDEMGVDYYD